MLRTHAYNANTSMSVDVPDHLLPLVLLIYDTLHQLLLWIVFSQVVKQF